MDNPDNPHDFSILIGHVPAGKKQVVLVRCNGWHGSHPNRLEIQNNSGFKKVPSDTFHIHYLTERYQISGKPDGYAEPTEEYNSFASAVDYVCDSFGFYFQTEYGRGSRYPLFD